MAHKTLIDGTAYEISGGKTLIGGTAYEIDKGKTLVGGTAYEVGFAQPMVTIWCLQEAPSRDQYTKIVINGTTLELDGYLGYVEPLEVPVGTVIEIILAETSCGCGEFESDWGFYVNGTKVSSNDRYQHTVNGNIFMEIKFEEDCECYNCYEAVYYAQCKITEVPEGCIVCYHIINSRQQFKCVAEEGMTWSEWVASAYNTDGYTIDGNRVRGPYNSYVAIYDAKYPHDPVTPSDVIIGNTLYAANFE